MPLPLKSLPYQTATYDNIDKYIIIKKADGNLARCTVQRFQEVCMTSGSTKPPLFTLDSGLSEFGFTANARLAQDTVIYYPAPTADGNVFLECATSSKCGVISFTTEYLDTVVDSPIRHFVAIDGTTQTVNVLTPSSNLFVGTPSANLGTNDVWFEPVWDGSGNMTMFRIYIYMKAGQLRSIFTQFWIFSDVS